MQVADRINQKMTEYNLSQADLIRGTGAGRATVSGWVNGTNNPSAKHLNNLAKTLKTTTSWLLTGIADMGQNLQSVEVWDDNTPLDEDEVEIPFFKDFSFACFLSCLHGSERAVMPPCRFYYFLSCLHGSEPRSRSKF